MNNLINVSLLMGLFMASFSFTQKNDEMLNPMEIPQVVVENQLIAYNAGDIEAFMAVFHEDIKVYQYGNETPVAEGWDAVKAIYADLFQKSPDLHSTLLNRTVIGSKVLDYEYIVGRAGSDEPLFLVMIYEVKDGKIYKATSIRA
ncbi:MAG: nuclear transport factor 2 family protein [Crocinitomicaceae bacterium]|nr:nuclear transport factor 2 family protein [Crocinitomicaceae bacterium]